jgi:hypothetical protein
MTDKFTSALLAALNESAEMKESDWNSIEAVLRQPVEAAEPAAAAHDTVDRDAAIDAVEPTEPVDLGWQAAPPRFPERPDGENRFAATISSGMAKIRSGR